MTDSVAEGLGAYAQAVSPSGGGGQAPDLSDATPMGMSDEQIADLYRLVQEQQSVVQAQAAKIEELTPAGPEPDKRTFGQRVRDNGAQAWGQDLADALDRILTPETIAALAKLVL